MEGFVGMAVDEQLFAATVLVATESEEGEVVDGVEFEEKTGAWHRAVELAVVGVGCVPDVGIEFDVVVVFVEAGREAIVVGAAAVAAAALTGKLADPFADDASFAAEDRVVEVADIAAYVVAAAPPALSASVQTSGSQIAAIDDAVVTDACSDSSGQMLQRR